MKRYGGGYHISVLYRSYTTDVYSAVGHSQRSSAISKQSITCGKNRGLCFVFFFVINEYYNISRNKSKAIFMTCFIVINHNKRKQTVVCFLTQYFKTEKTLFLTACRFQFAGGYFCLWIHRSVLYSVGNRCTAYQNAHNHKLSVC